MAAYAKKGYVHIQTKNADASLSRHKHKGRAWRRPIIHNPQIALNISTIDIRACKSVAI